MAKTKKSQSADGPTFRQEAPVAGNAHNPTKAFFEALCLTQCGSPAYTAPEVLGRKPYGQQADVWTAIDLIRGLLTPDPKERLRLPQLIAHPWLTGTEQVKPSIPQADEFPLEFTSSVDVAAEVGRPHRLKRAGCGRRASNAKSQSPYGSRSPQEAHGG
ncbi:unnamed protein product [Dibothriocephalus latus]|uniref:Protein kinase domain-containing protein n=1 Tax=Dibothriocephalus latus TaxID=60516 RepID=A0A3P7Q0Y1_DIBLA|nr:unnamed protein product [Dibothriocephalus latus]